MTNGRRAAAEAWWALIARILSFIAGVGILGWMTVHNQTSVPLIVAAVALTGPVVAQSAATVFAAMRGGANE